MRRRFLLVLCTLLVTTSSAFARSKEVSSASEPPAQLASRIPQWMQQARVPGLAIAKIEDGKVAWTQVFGERAPGVPLTRDTVFNVASLTKPVFAMMTLQLAAAGELGLDAPLAEHWEDPDIAGDERRLALTPRLALSHQTGFQNWRGNGRLAFAFAPGTRHEYSGEGYEYLRKAIEHKTGQSLRKLMRTQVLNKAGMRHTVFGWSASLDAPVATGFDASAQPYDMAFLKTRQPSAAASMLTTIDDYARFTAWVAAGADLPRPLFDEMRRAQARRADPAEYFGLGWRLVRVGEAMALAHDGREGGVRTQVFVLPESREGLVVLTNSDNGELLMRSIAEAALSRGPQMMDQVAKDTWLYLARQPGAHLSPMLQSIARSPSFMEKLLYAADATLLAQAGLDEAERREARAGIDRFVMDMSNGRVDSIAALRIAQSLVETDAGAARLRNRMSPEQARAWIKAIQSGPAAAGASTAAASVQVPDAVLASYVGSYRVPSSQLMISVTRAGTSLQATAKGMPVITLHPESHTRFYMKEDATKFEFVRDDKKVVTGLMLLWTGGRSEYASKIE